MKIVVVGNGKMGFEISRELADEGHSVTVIDSDSEVLEKTATVLDVACIRGSGVSCDVQTEAGVPESDLLIAVTSYDEINIICCLIAKKLGAKATIARIRTPDYVQAARFMREDLGLSMYVNPELEAATEVSRLLRYPSALKIDFFNRGKVALLEFKLPETTPLVGMPLHMLKPTYHLQVLICAVQRGGEVFIPRGDFVLHAGDTVNLTGSPLDITSFLKATGMGVQRVKNVMLLGGGRISYYLTSQLCEVGINVTVIERDRMRCEQLCEQLPARALIVNGDATDQELLREENIDEMDAVVSLTGMDEENVIMSMFASLRNVKRVIAKINHISLSGILERSGVDCTITPHLIAANQIVRYVRAMQNATGSNVESLTRLVNNKVEALEFHVTGGFKGADKPIKDLLLIPNLLIASIVRGGKVIHPVGSDVIRADDSVIVVTTESGLDDLNDILA